MLHFVLVSVAVAVSPGDIDLPFGINGTVLTSIPASLPPAPPAFPRLILDVTRTLDGRLAVAGTQAVQGGQDSMFGLINDDGSVDRSVASPDFLTIDLSFVISAPYLPSGTTAASFGGVDELTHVATQRYASEERVLAGGDAYSVLDLHQDIVVVAVTPQLTLDDSFGDHGIAHVDTLSFEDETLADMAVYPATAGADAGKIVLLAHQPALNDDNALLIRLTKDGALDPAFGSGGLVPIHLASHPASGAPRRLRIDAAGRILVGVNHFDPVPDWSWWSVHRYMPNGSQDGAFGTSGHVAPPLALGTHISLVDLAMTNNTFCVLAATAATTTSYTLEKHTATGAPSSGFGTAGVASVTFESSAHSPKLLVSLRDDRWVVVGTGTNPDTTVGFSVFLASGAQDLSFDADGKRTVGDDETRYMPSSYYMAATRDWSDRVTIASGSALYRFQLNPAADQDADGVSAGSGDCNDSDATIKPGQPEACNARDDDCSGLIDDSAVDASLFHADRDHDGSGDPTASVAACQAPRGYVANANDCDDTNAAMSPAHSEVCGDGLDNDCDGSADNAATGLLAWYLDNDGDGDGDPASSQLSCAALPERLNSAGDCNDNDSTVGAHALEDAALCGDGIDQDCSGADLSCAPADPSGQTGVPGGTDAGPQSPSDAGSNQSGANGASTTETGANDRESEVGLSASHKGCSAAASGWAMDACLLFALWRRKRLRTASNDAS